MDASEERPPDEPANDGITGATLYNARDELGIEEFETENRKWWRFPTD